MKDHLSYTHSATVASEQTAKAMGSGDMEVLGTPALVALMEHAAMKAVANELPEGNTTVGSEICCRHLRPTPVGETVTATASLTGVENGRKLTFRIEAHDGRGLIGEAEHVRYIVDRERFLQKLS